MKILLTGGAGFIGSCFLWKLNSLGIEDVLVVDVGEAPSQNKNLEKKTFSDYVSREDLMNRLEAGQLKDVDVVVHLGACADTTEMDRQYLTQNNVEYSQKLALWSLSNGKRFHYASSAAIYGSGDMGYDDSDGLLDRYTALNPYGDSKLQFDRWLVKKGLSNQVVGYRYFNVFGPNEYHKGDMKSMVAKAYQQIISGGPVKLFASTRQGFGDGSEERDFVYIKDILDVMAYFLNHPEKNGIFNLGTGKARSFKDLILAVFAGLKREPNIEFVPMPEKLRGQYQYFTQAHLDKLRKAGYQRSFRSLEESVADYVQNHLANADPIL